MTMKTKRSLAVGGGTVLCAALAILIATRFAPEPEATAPYTSDTSSTPPISVEVSTAKREEAKSIEIENPAESTIIPDNGAADSASEEINAEFIENGGIEIEQNFPEPEKTESNLQSEPPSPPQIEDEEMLTNPDKEPTYEPEQTEVKPQSETPSDTPKHGDKEDGMVYINGFGWIKDEGGGGLKNGSSENFWNPGNDGVRVSVVDAETGVVKSASIDYTNTNASDIALHFGKVSKAEYVGGTGLSATTSAYTFINPTEPLPTIISDGSGANIEAIRSYFTDEQVVRRIAEHTGIEFDDLTNGDYKLMVEPIMYITYNGIRTAMTATEAALYNYTDGRRSDQ